MKKLTLRTRWGNPGLLLLCLMLALGCKKELLQPQSEGIRNGLSINEAKAYFDQNLQKGANASKIMAKGRLPKGITHEDILGGRSPRWDYAYQKRIALGGAVKIPLDFGRVNVRLNGGKGMVPFGSLNYLLMYKDSLQRMHADWVFLLPDSAWLYGNRSTYAGKVIIKDWDGKVKKVYKYGKAKTLAVATQGKLKPGKLMTIDQPEGNIAPADPICLIWPVKEKCNCPWAWDGSSWSPDKCDYCDGCVDVMCVDPPITDGSEPPTGGGSPGGLNDPPSGDALAGSESGGTVGPDEVMPTCELTAGYVPPTYPAPAGEDYPQACGDDGIPVPVEPDGIDTPDPVDADSGPNIQPSAVVWSEIDGRFISFSEVTAAVMANPGFIDDLLEDNVYDHGLPMLPIYWSTWPEASIRDWMLEFSHLRLMHPNWDPNATMAVALWNTYRNEFHFALDLVGFVPVIGEAADIVNGAIYFAEGEHLNAAMSFGAAIPVVGWVSTGGKWVKAAAPVMTKSMSSVAGKVAYRAVKTSKGAVKFVKVAVGGFNHYAVKALKAVKPADKSLTNLSKTLLEQMGHRIRPLSGSLKSKVDDIVLHADATGVKTEALCDEMFESGGFVKYDAKFGSNNGFDGVYIKKDAGGNVQEIIINEAKQVSDFGNIKLNAGNDNTGLGAQMSDAWIKNGIEQLKNNASTASLGNMLEPLFRNNRNLFAKTVTGVDKKTSEIIIVKLSPY